MPRRSLVADSHTTLESRNQITAAFIYIIIIFSLTFCTNEMIMITSTSPTIAHHYC